MRLSLPEPLHVFTHEAHSLTDTWGLAISSHRKRHFDIKVRVQKPTSAPWQVSPQTERAPLHFDSQIAWRDTARPRRTRGFREIQILYQS
jgi:hypothetical protein